MDWGDLVRSHVFERDEQSDRAPFVFENSRPSRLTRRAVQNCPFDEGVILPSARHRRSLFCAARLRRVVAGRYSPIKFGHYLTDRGVFAHD